MTSAPRVAAPLALLLVLTAGALAYLIYFGELFPPRMAVHFTSTGAPDGWMDRLKFIVIASSFAFILPPFVVACVGVLPRVLPIRLVNLPNREHWLAPERRERTLQWMLSSALWLGCLVAGLVIAIIVLIAKANPPVGPASLSPSHPWVIGTFVAAIVLWTWRMIRAFARPRQE